MNRPSYPITTVTPLRLALCKVPGATPLILRTRDQSEYQLDGVEVLVNDDNTPVAFVLAIGPKES